VTGNPNYNNPTLYAQPPQAPPSGTANVGAGGGTNPGQGTGHGGTGGGGGKKH
jgi:hypothetical protein